MPFLKNLNKKMKQVTIIICPSSKQIQDSADDHKSGTNLFKLMSRYTIQQPQLQPYQYLIQFNIKYLIYYKMMFNFYYF
ncbi:unnamed protein product [Paramecium primaurelia]|uniref:Uncharacterized protein n=1 Tax=Paramecium primaurelia TaxID=5886 RepID=A0A8S1PAV5_PARPR|nr:unnamed protein product [Paramecium primaurelia]